MAEKKTTTKTETKAKAEKPVVKAKADARVALLEINNMQYASKVGETIEVRVGANDTAEAVVNLLGVVDGDKFEYGKPYLTNKLSFEFGEAVKQDKVTTAKFKAKSRYRRKTGARPVSVQFTLTALS